MARETRRRLLAIHVWFIAAGALLALLLTIVDQAFGLGKGGLISFENLLTILAWLAFAVVATLSTVVVLVLARSRKHVVIINLAVPFGLLMGAYLYAVPKRGKPALFGDAAVQAAPRCLAGLDSWSWTEPDPLSAILHLEVTMSVPNTVSLYASADGSGGTSLLAQDWETKRALPAGKSTWDVPLARFQPGRPQSWLFTFQCVHDQAQLAFSKGHH